MSQDGRAGAFYDRDGKTSEGPAGTFPVFSPIDGRLIADVPECGEREAARAADLASEAFTGWRRAGVYERAGILRRWQELLLKGREQVAQTMSLEMGKPITEARGEVDFAASYIEWFAEEMKRVNGEILPSRKPGQRIMVSRHPVGPVFCVTPWNLPAAMVTRSAAPALAAGCTIILKPAEQTPLTALLLGSLWDEAGGPPGTFQVLPCGDPVPASRVLMGDRRIRKLAFTGSHAVGTALYGQAAATMKRISLELGGHAAFLVFEDADIEKATQSVLQSKFTNAGQSCISTNRVFVHRSILEEFQQVYAEKVRALRLGDPLDEATNVGPLVNAQALDKVEAHVQDATKNGARVLTGGKAAEGLYYEPTVLTDVRPDALIMTEETFGPVVPIVGFDTEEEAVTAANASQYGLAAYFWTKDVGRVFRMADELEAGVIGVNEGFLGGSPQVPFGGVKDSGIGRTGGKWGLDEFLNTKYLAVTPA